MSENELDVRTRLFGEAFLGLVESMTGVAVVTAITIGALYFGRELFVPIALAILLSFVLAPLVGALERWRVSRGLSVVSVVLLAFLSIFALGGVIAAQVAEWEELSQRIFGSTSMTFEDWCQGAPARSYKAKEPPYDVNRSQRPMPLLECLRSGTNGGARWVD